MLLSELKTSLSKQERSPLYIFVGEERVIMQKFVDMVAGQKAIIRPAIVADIYQKLQTKSFFATSGNCYCVTDDKEFLAQEKIWANADYGDNILIVTYTKLDKRSKFYAANKDKIVEFERVSPVVMQKYIKRELDITDVAAEALGRFCMYDYGIMLMEVDKIRQLAEARNISQAAALSLAIKEETIHQYHVDDSESNIFSVVEAICKRRVKIALAAVKQLEQEGQSPLGLLSLLYTNFKQMFLVRAAGNQSDIISRTGLTPFQIKMATQKGNAFSLDELQQILQLIQRAESGIKEGKMDAEIAASRLLVGIFNL